MTDNQELLDSLVEPCLTIAKVEFRDGSLAVVAVVSKAERAVLNSIAVGIKELSSADIKKLSSHTKIPTWHYGLSGAEKLKESDYFFTIEELSGKKVSVTREKKGDSDETD